MRLAAVSLVALAWATPARADLRALVDTLVAKQKETGAEVVVLPTRFLYEGESFSLDVPESKGGKKCTSVELVGARGLSFHVTTGEKDGGKVSSAAGALELVSCDAGSFGALHVQSDAGRGALEIVVAHSDDPMPSLRDVLPERALGASSVPPEPGPAPPLPPSIKRAESAEERAKRDGAKVVSRATITAGHDGAGVGRFDAEPGCHRIDLASNEPVVRRRGRVDLDAELSVEDGDAVLARDRGEAADARLEVCVGATTPVRLVFAGASPDDRVLVSHAFWPLPRALPAAWSAETKAHVAGAFVANRAPSPLEEPAMVWLGGAGATTLSAALEPGACYFAVVGLSHGTARGLRLRAMVGELLTSEERAAQEGGALVTFCARDRDQATLEVDARGTSIAWTLALFRAAAPGWGP